MEIIHKRVRVLKLKLGTSERCLSAGRLDVSGETSLPSSEPARFSPTRVSYENAVSMTQFDVREAPVDLEFSLQELEAVGEALADVQFDLAEAQYHVERGEAMNLDLAQSELAVRIAERNVAGAHVEVARY